VLRRIVDFSLGHPLLVLVATAALAAAGLIAFARLPIDVFPDLDAVHAEIVAPDPGLDSYDVEKQITLPLERALLTVPNMENMRSLSMFGLSDVKLRFREGTDWDAVRHDVTIALQGVALPPGVTWSIAPPSNALGTIFRYTIEAPKLDLIEKRSLQDWVVAPQIQRVPGVAGVSTFGGGGKEFQVNVDPAKLQQYGVTLDQVFTALSANNANAGGSYITRGDTALIVRSEGLLRDLRDIENIVVANSGGAPVLVSNVGRVERASIPRVGAFNFNAENDTIEGIVLMLIGQDPGTVCEGVQERLHFVEKNLLPPGVRLVPIYDRRDLTSNVVSTVLTNGVKGVILVLLLLFVFFSDLRTAAIVAALIPLSLLFSFLLAYLTGVPANLLSLGAIDFGVVIDGGLVIVEAACARIVLAGSRAEEVDVVRGTAHELAPSVFSALLIIVAAFLPIFMFRGVVGRMFGPVALIFTVAMCGALLLSLTFVPAAARLLISNRPSLRESLPSRAIEAAYRPFLRWGMKHALPLTMLAVLLMVEAALLGARIERTFLPDLEEGDIYMDHDFPIAASVATTQRIEEQVAGAILGFKNEVKSYYGEVGRTDDGLTPNAMNHVEGDIELLPRERWDPQFKSKADLRAAIDARLAAIPGAEFNHDMYITDSLHEGLSGFNGEVVISIHGYDIAYMEEVADRMVEVFKRVRGVADPQIKREMGLPMVAIKIDHAAVARYGIPIQEVQTTIDSAVTGATSTTFYEDDRTFPVVIRLAPKFRESIDALKNLLVAAPSGALIPLAQLARVDVVNGPQRIWRVNYERIMPVQFNVVDRGLVDVVEECQRRFKAEVEPTLRPGYFVTWEGEFEEANRAMRTTALAIPISILLIYLLHVAHFKRAKYALLCMVAYPFGAIGGVIALKLTGTFLSISAMIGFLALGGITAIDGIILVARFNTLREEGKPLEEAVFEGAMSRLRPVVMTALAGIFGFVPMILSDRMGSEVQKPIATVVVGGLVTSTILTLVILPAFYLVLERWLASRKERRADLPEPAVPGAAS
jgi:cobalt-zinc-cadmium resistance protein CzcA